MDRTTLPMKQELINRMEYLLTTTYIPNPYFKNKEEWEKEVKQKINEIKTNNHGK